MKINEELLKIIRASNLDMEEALLFCFAVSQPNYDMLNKLLETEIITPENEYLYRINLVNRGESSEHMELRFPLYQEDTTHRNLFSEFVNRLASYPGMSMKGHLSNEKSYIVINSSKDTEKLFYTVFDANVDMNRLVEATVQYYKEVEFCKALPGYLQEVARTYYDNYKEGRSNLI